MTLKELRQKRQRPPDWMRELRALVRKRRAAFQRKRIKAKAKGCET